MALGRDGKGLSKPAIDIFSFADWKQLYENKKRVTKESKELARA